MNKDTAQRYSRVNLLCLAGVSTPLEIDCGLLDRLSILECFWRMSLVIWDNILLFCTSYCIRKSGNLLTFQALWCYRIHAFDLLEAQVLSNEPAVPQRLYSIRSILSLRHRIVLSITYRTSGCSVDSWHLHCFDLVCMSNEVWLCQLAAILVWSTLVLDHLRIHGFILPEQHHRAHLLWSCRINILRLHSGGYSVDHETLPCWRRDCSCHQSLPWYYQPVSRHPSNPQ